MSNLKLHTPTEATYEGWMAFLDGKDRKIGHNTYASVMPDAVAIRYHGTVIVKFYNEGTIVLNSGGWQTSTTKNRMNMLLPRRYGISQKDFVWRLMDHHEVVDHFFDGIEIRENMLPMSEVI
jgi:hypothetical protein